MGIKYGKLLYCRGVAEGNVDMNLNPSRLWEQIWGISGSLIWGGGGSIINGDGR